MLEKYGLSFIAGALLFLVAIVVYTRIPRVGKKTRIRYIPYDKKFFVYKRRNGKQYSRIGEKIHVQVVLWSDGHHHARIGSTEAFNPSEKVLVLQ